ncbi:microprocessor complex subunit dgcr8 [Dermatophagoides farinae]|uniref:Microprocessor complex subunit dgcr8 n=1 Tax=Dermatophagoides farinae TaxID=6954 RepID=A0A9D4NTR2_DERFA|nr:microprocessor complex subunit DGCR8-like [Dermatophagoides farinae]KAH7637610.1 microprocessor complex subunit dgcr8 [Dermatophagoides farinae]
MSETITENETDSSVAVDNCNVVEMLTNETSMIDDSTNNDPQQCDHNDSTTTISMMMNEISNNDQDNDVDDQCSINSFDSDDDDDDDYSFVDNMLEESVDIESLKRCEQVKRKLDDLDNEDVQIDQQIKLLSSTTTAAVARITGKPGKKRATKSRIETKQKNILVKRGHDLFEILPEGWVEITHFSGMPIYLDKRSRVCTLSKPYHLGTGSARKHHIPLSAIPCLQYRNELEKERKIREELESKCLNNNNVDGNGNGDDGSGQQSLQPPQPIAKVETLEENKKERSLEAAKVREYCRRLFEFKTVTVKKFTNWADRRKHEQSKKLAQRPSLPESTKLITCTIPKIPATVNGGGGGGGVSAATIGKPFKKEFIMNPVGKSDICILHEYVQHTERTQPKYEFQELENVSKPYCATVFINEMEYGKGYGSSKKEAKTEAARASLDILIPDLKQTLNQEQNRAESLNDLKFFDSISIEDQRVSELCLKAGQYSPYQILVECIKRLYGFEDMDIKTDTRIVKHHKIEFKMTAGQHEAVVICKNKREGKQRAAQKILKSIHPQLTCWGALLKLYGQGSCKTSKEKKEEAQKITELQNNACSNKPNYAILNKLKEEMLKLHDENGKQRQQRQLQLSSLPAVLNATVVGKCGGKMMMKNRKEKMNSSSQNL